MSYCFELNIGKFNFPVSIAYCINHSLTVLLFTTSQENKSKLRILYRLGWAFRRGIYVKQSKLSFQHIEKILPKVLLFLFRQIGQPIDEVDETPQQGQIDSLTSFLLQLLTEILY